MASNREWMYTMRLTQDGYFNLAFERHVRYFLNFAFSNAINIQRSNVKGAECPEIRCPCSKCKNRYFKTKEMVEFDICRNGFMPACTLWYAHGESYPVSSQRVGQCSNPVPSQHVGQCPNSVPSEDNDYNCGDYTGPDQMLMENMHQNHARYQDPNRAAKTFYDMLEEANEPLYPGCEKVSKFSFITRLLKWKSECNVSDSAFNKLLPILKDILPDGAKVPTNFYEAKKMMNLLQLPKEKIHVCKNHCMLFYKEHSQLEKCLVCNADRYRTWHSKHRTDSGKMIHPSDGMAGTKEEAGIEDTSHHMII